jgi:predicted small metal-binding protein
LTAHASIKLLKKLQSKVSITSARIDQDAEIRSPQELLDDIADNNKEKIKRMEERQENEIESIKHRIFAIRSDFHTSLV